LGHLLFRTQGVIQNTFFIPPASPCSININIIAGLKPVHSKLAETFMVFLPFLSGGIRQQQAWFF